MEQSETPKNENRIQVILTLDMENLPDNFSEILKEEQEVVAKWKAEGILEHLYLRQQRNGAVLVLKNVDEAKARELMEKLPFFKLKKSIEYYNLIKQY
jgi:muconolactone D-isomerase